ncbi:MAG: hypothetical protein ACK4VZ_15830 [Paracoccaceae bacterium]
MHNVDKNSEGQLVGWVGGSADGRPARINLSCSDRIIQVFAVQDRGDVLRAGFTRFSGFNLRISAHSRECVCQARLEENTYDITPSVKRDDDLIQLDDVGRNHISGWVKNAEDLSSLSFFSVTGLSRAEIHKRADVNAFLGTSPEKSHGFRVEFPDFSELFAVSVNNKLIHWLTPGWLEKLAAKA